MPFISTGGRTPETSLAQALFQGLAPDGGLFMPRELPSISPEEIRAMEREEWPGVASTVARALLADTMPPEAIRTLVEGALDFPLPIRPLGDRIRILELFHGPTLAFKDVGARVMARLMAHFRPDGASPLTILTATSGDTGGAVADAFQGLPGVRVVVLFPDGMVTPRQERQFSTLGGNVRAVAVQGDFDDCQRMAKEAFRNRELREAVSLTSANSINVGRLIPQSFYYFHALARLRARGRVGPLLFAVPSGNFGNLAAGLMAKAMGLPDVSFLAATNDNDVVPAYLAKGIYRPRSSLRTLSTAMDVGDPSNLARILHLYHGELDALRKDLTGTRVDDEETRGCIRRVYEKHGYVLDPHSAVGYRALEEALEDRPQSLGVLLSTAHPAKFAEVVEPVLGHELPLPGALAAALERERRVVPMEPEADVLAGFLREG